MKITKRQLEKTISEAVAKELREASGGMAQHVVETLAGIAYSRISDQDETYGWRDLEDIKNHKRYVAKVNPKLVSKLIKTWAKGEAKKVIAAADETAKEIIKDALPG